MSPDVAPTDHHAAVARLRDWLSRHPRLFVLTGAGVSTASGIPDYRDTDGQWKRSAPITLREFLHDEARRRRYWARSLVGWPVVEQATPNAAHSALVALQEQNRLQTLVTQNVDGLHSRAGQRGVIDLHGRIDRVVCLGCGRDWLRSEVQHWLIDANPEWRNLRAGQAPDGDADLERDDFENFRIPHCPGCSGMLKPDVVFFGESVPRDRVERAMSALEAADAMLVVGSSLMVYSGFRFARRAGELAMPLAILTRGVSRADSLATLKLNADCGDTLAVAVSELATTRGQIP